MAGPLATVATVTSPQSFRINGTDVPVAGVPNWPVVPGDVIETGNAPALVKFRDGGTVYLLARTKVTITTSANRVEARLETGALSYNLPKDSRVDIAALKKERIPQRSGSGRLVASGGEGYWNPLDAAFLGADPRQQEPIIFHSYRLNNFNLDFVGKWREYEPDWSAKPGEIGKGTLPPAPEIRPPLPAPTSNWQP
ncbi:MAG: hypothetical protein KIT09_05260 [Bryobacteraceae bacterium]|nr:hypothetical protein [Bryobacteraceae bacterium]